MAVGYSDLESMKVAYPPKIINLLLDDKKDDGLPEEDVFDIVNGNVGIMIRQKLNKRYSAYFTAWETTPHETVNLISDRITIYEYYVRKGRTPPGKIVSEYKAAKQLLQDLADNKENLTGITLDDAKSPIWSTESGGTFTLDERDKTTNKVTKRGTMHYF